MPPLRVAYAAQVELNIPPAVLAKMDQMLEGGIAANMLMASQYDSLDEQEAAFYLMTDIQSLQLPAGPLAAMAAAVSVRLHRTLNNPAPSQ